METVLLGQRHALSLTWRPPLPQEEPFLGARRILVEWGAECIALLVLCGYLGWKPIRRLIDGEAADWLLADEAGTESAVEVSGTDDGEIRRVLAAELRQLDGCRAGERRFAFVVRFASPEAHMVEHS
jgi:hypothetical protein